ncbi:MAG: hypothetical protein Q7N50_13395 [Armatimonadota bacterium]|nr:hypothetical protein [Armatimonadota bacterium]
MAIGTLSCYRVQKDGKTAIRVVVAGNVGAAGRAVLDTLHMTMCTDMANRRERIVSTPAELDALRDALLLAGIVAKPPSA